MPQVVRREMEALADTYNFKATRVESIIKSDGSAYRCFFYRKDECVGRITLEFDKDNGIVKSRKVEKALAKDMKKNRG